MKPGTVGEVFLGQPASLPKRAQHLSKVSQLSVGGAVTRHAATFEACTLSVYSI
jgi:hypothetical protein